jgi:hypothetical protein
MKTGLLWFDNNPKRTLEAKVADGARRYHEKFGQRPNACYVNPEALAQGKLRIGSVEVIAARYVLPNHFWIGISESRE